MTLIARIHRRWRNLPFAQKLAALLIALVSVPIIFVVMYTTYASREALIAATLARNLERAQATAQGIDAFFNDVRADVRTVSGLSAVIELCAQPQTDERLERAVRSLHAIRAEQRMLALYITDRTGRVLASTDGRAPLGSLQTGREFLGAIAGDTAIDDPTYDTFDQRVTLRISHAVRASSGAIIGTTTGVIDLLALDEVTRGDANYGGFGEFGVLWMGIGLRLSHSTNSHERFTSWSPLPADTAITTRQRLGPVYPTTEAFDPGFTAVVDRGQWLLYDAGTNPHLRVESATAGALHMTAVPLRGLRWVYGIFVPEAQLLEALRSQMLRDWAVAFFTVMAALTLSVIAARWVTKPLNVVTDAANALARGEMTRRVALGQHDEFGQLSAAFDSMATALADHERQLQAHAADLERRVEERTATLHMLERTSRTLASSLELRRTAMNLATLLVPAWADFCAIEIRDLNGHLKRLACRHVDAQRERFANELADVRTMHDPATTLTAEERAVLALTDVRAYELSAGRQFVGYLTIGQADSQRTFDESQERVFEELGRRAGLALANALLYQEAQDANRLKDEFLGVVSHELRTPLNAIMGWTRLASMHRESGIDSHQALEAIERNAQALARLVDDLLDVPRIMMGKLALDIHALDLVVLLNDAVDAIRPAAASKSLAVELYSELPTAIIEGDEQRLQQVFGNILSNAVKFTPAGGRITMQLRHADDAYTVTVEDTGIGIRKDFLPFVFDRFRQADSSTTRAHGGLGIGLSLVRQLVDMHGGQVTAASGGPGLGSSFTVRLPLTAAEPISPAEIVRPDDAAVARLQGMRLLLLDDDPDAQEVATRTLRSNGAIVQNVASVEEAARVLTHNAEEFDAILADIGLPGQDGYDFIASVRGSPDARLRTLPVVAVTAYASRSDHARAIAAGFDAHVAKPVTLGDLAIAVAEAVASRAR